MILNISMDGHTDCKHDLSVLAVTSI